MHIQQSLNRVHDVTLEGILKSHINIFCYIDILRSFMPLRFTFLFCYIILEYVTLYCYKIM